jgi:hypothetical protein
VRQNLQQKEAISQGIADFCASYPTHVTGWSGATKQNVMATGAPIFESAIRYNCGLRNSISLGNIRGRHEYKSVRF